MFISNRFNQARVLALTYVFQSFLISTTIATAEDENASTREQRELTDITITADPFNHSLLEHSSPATVLGKDELMLKIEPTIGETIGQEPGVSSSYFGPGASRPIIRGNAGDRIRVLKNGVGTLDISNTSEDHAVSSNPLSAESIEILRGPETLLFGSSAIGGVVNIKDNSIPEQAIGKPLTGKFNYRQGTADDELSAAIALDGQISKFNWHIDYFHQDTNDVDIPGFAESAILREQEELEGAGHEDEEDKGKLDNSSSRTQGFTLGTSYIWDDGFIGVSFSGNDSKYGVPGHSHEEEVEEHSSHEEEAGVAIDLQQYRVDVRGQVREVNEVIERAKFKLGLSTYQHEELEEGEVETKFENDALEGRIELTHVPISSLEGVLGFQVQASKFSAIGEESFLPRTNTFSPAIFLFEELPLNDFWKLQAGARYDFVRYDADGFSSDEFNPLGLSTGVVWDPTGRSHYTVGFSLSYTERAPALSELYANGAHAARQIFELGNPNLGNENSYGFDLTIKKNTGLVTGELNLFAQEYDDYINLSATSMENGGMPVFNYESIRASFWGLEAQTTLHLHEALDLWAHDIDLNVQVDWVRAENQSKGGNLPRIPPLRTIIGLDYQYKFLFGARVEGIFVSKQDRTEENELPTDGYQMLNASLHYNLPVNESQDLALYVRGTNLTDQEARVHSSFLKDLAPLRARSLLFGVSGTF